MDLKLSYDPWTNFLNTELSEEAFNEELFHETIKQGELKFDVDVTSFFLHEDDHARRTVTSTSGLMLRRAISILRALVIKELDKNPIKEPLINRELFDDVLLDIVIADDSVAEIANEWLFGKQYEKTQTLKVAGILAFTEAVSGYHLVPSIADSQPWKDVKQSRGFRLLLGMGAASVLHPEQETFSGIEVGNVFVNDVVPTSWNLPLPIGLMFDPANPVSPRVYGESLDTIHIIECLGMSREQIHSKSGQEESFTRKTTNIHVPFERSNTYAGIFT